MRLLFEGVAHFMDIQLAGPKLSEVGFPGASFR